MSSHGSLPSFLKVGQNVKLCFLVETAHMANIYSNGTNNEMFQKTICGNSLNCSCVNTERINLKIGCSFSLQELQNTIMNLTAIFYKQETHIPNVRKANQNAAKNKETVKNHHNPRPSVKQLNQNLRAIPKRKQNLCAPGGERWRLHSFNSNFILY